MRKSASMTAALLGIALLFGVMKGDAIGQKNKDPQAQEKKGQDKTKRSKGDKDSSKLPIRGGKYNIPQMMEEGIDGPLRILGLHTDPPQWKIDLLKRAHEVFSGNAKARYDVLVADAAFREIMKSQKRKLLGGPMLGQVSETGAVVWVRTLGPGEISIQVTQEGKTRLFGPVKGRAEDDFAVGVAVDGLKPGSSNPYTVLLDGQPVPGAEGVIRTVPSRNVRIAFGSCSHRWGLGYKEIWSRMLSRNPSALLIYGDVAVQDRNANFAMHRFDYLLRELHDPWANLVAHLPVYANWDDHDYMDNDRSGLGTRHGTGGGGVTDADRREIRRIFKTSWSNPAYGFGDEKGGIFLRTRIGPADVIMTDNRYFREVEGPYLGDGQMKWLEEQLLECKGPFIIMTCGTLWSDHKGAGKDSWGKYDQEGRERIFSLIEKHHIPGVLLLSGDWHGARGYKIPRPSGYTFYEFQPASLGGRNGGQGNPIDLSKNKREDRKDWLFGYVSRYAFGEFTFDVEKDDPTVTFRLVLEDGTEYYTLTLSRSQLTP